MAHASIDAAVASARGALEAWSGRPREQRAAVASAYADQLREHKAELANLISAETFKPKWESATEVEAMIGKVALSIRAQDERRRPVESVNDGVTTATRYKPFGVVAVLGPFNFPGHLPNGHIVPALLAGNTIVFKPSELTPRAFDRPNSWFTSEPIPERKAAIMVCGYRQGGIELKSVPNGLLPG